MRTQPKIATRETTLQTLLFDFGYRVEGKILIENAIPGFTSERIVTRVSSLYDAAERLCPLVRDDEFTRRFTGLG